MSKHLYVDYMAFDDEGRVSEFTWAEARTRRSWWQRLLRRPERVDAIYTNPAELPGWNAESAGRTAEDA